MQNFGVSKCVELNKEALSVLPSEWFMDFTANACDHIVTGIFRIIIYSMD